MSRLIVFMSMSLDGFIAADGDGPGLGLGVDGAPLHDWIAHVDPDRPADAANRALTDEILATGAVITGRHTFDWAGRWGGDHHDGVPIFVLTRSVPSDPVRGNVHYTDDPVAAAAQARAAAGDRDVMMHGASSVRAMLDADEVDELAITISPVLLGSGRRLFEDRRDEQRALRLLRSEAGEGAVHLRYGMVSPAEAPTQ